MGVYLLDNHLFSRITLKYFISLTISMKSLLLISNNSQSNLECVETINLNIRKRKRCAF